MRLSKLILLLIFILITALWIESSQAEGRSDLHLFQYGRTNTDLLKTAFLDFRDMLAEKLPQLSGRLSPNATNQVVSHLKLNPVLNEKGVLERPEVRVGSLADKRQYWLETGALILLTGHMRLHDGVPYVYTTFFWGNLKGPYTEETIKIKLPVTGEAFDSTYDSHSVAILYALAHEIGQDCHNIKESIYLLGEASLHAQAISEDYPELGAKLGTLVDNAIDIMKSDCSE